MDTITLNGEEYVRASEVASYGSADYSHVCVIATNGWIFEGKRDSEQDGRDIELFDAHVVRCWDNGLGIGGLADPETKDDYTLDALGVINVYGEKVIAVMPLRW